MMLQKPVYCFYLLDFTSVILSSVIEFQTQDQKSLLNVFTGSFESLYGFSVKKIKQKPLKATKYLKCTFSESHGN